MKKIGITTESAADLSEELIKKYNIGIVNFKANLEKIKDIPGNIFNKMRVAEEKGIESVVKTSQPSIAQYLDLFKKKLEEFEEIVHISVSLKVSGAYNSAMQAKKFLGKQSEKIHILDSEKASGAQAFLALKAAEDIEKGLDLKEIIDNFNKRIKETFIIFMYDNPKWLKAGGRFPKIAQIGLQKMKDFNIGILMREKEGVIKPMAIRRNVKNLADPLFDEFKKFTKDTKKKISVIISHADNIKEVNELKQKIETLENTKVLYVSLMDVVLGAHAGPNTLVLNFMYE